MTFPFHLHPVGTGGSPGVPSALQEEERAQDEIPGLMAADASPERNDRSGSETSDTRSVLRALQCQGGHLGNTTLPFGGKSHPQASRGSRQNAGAAETCKRPRETGTEPPGESVASSWGCCIPAESFCASKSGSGQ